MPGGASCGEEQHSYLQANEFGRERRQLVVPAFSPAERDQAVLAFNKSSFVEPAAKRCDHVGRFGRRPAAEKADHRHGRLPRPRREREAACELVQITIGHRLQFLAPPRHRLPVRYDNLVSRRRRTLPDRPHLSQSGPNLATQAGPDNWSIAALTSDGRLAYFAGFMTMKKATE